MFEIRSILIFKAYKGNENEVNTFSRLKSFISFELAIRSSRERIFGLTSSAVDAMAFSIRFSVPKSTFKHFGFDVGQRIPCNACRVSIASLKNWN